DDSYFDEGFRALLSGVYDSLGQEVPRFVRVPIIQTAPITPERPFSGKSTPEIDGQPDPAWETAAYYPFSGDGPVAGMYATLDKENIYLRLDLKERLRDHELGFYFRSPGFEGPSTAFAHESDILLGFNANKFLSWTGGMTVDVYDAQEDGWGLFDLGAGRAMMGDDVMEFSLPLRLLGELSAGDALRMTLILEPEGTRFPDDGPAQIVLPDLGETAIVLEVQDPVGDDYGPGTYVYPEDAVFKESVFDANSFSVGYDQENLVLKFGFVGPVENPWGSPNGLSLQTLDVYIDTDPDSATGARQLLPGRNAALVEGSGWEYVVWAEGWNPQVMQVDPETGSAVAYSEASSALKINVDTAKNEVVIRVPLYFFGEEEPENWAYAAVVLSQEGYPSEGVWRVRDIAPTPAQYLLGGAPADVNHTRIIDLILPEDAPQDQAELLSRYPSTQDAIDTLSPDDFPQIPMLEPGNE
ncbi:MAG: glucodextranase DOMON-like domain-containing protein, partial [Brevefilum sp.]